MQFFPRQLVVVPSDFTAESDAALRVALDLVRSTSDIHVVHVLTTGPGHDPKRPADAEIDRQRHDSAMALMERRFRDDKLRGIHLHVRVGRPGREIAALADLLSADLLVMPSHGRKGMERLRLGSVAERVIRFARCPVLVLRS